MIRRAFCLTAFLLAGSASAADLVVLRDGSRRGGTLRACAGGRCSIDGSAIAQSDIAWIGFGAGRETAPPAPPREAKGDAVILRDGRVVADAVVGVSLGAVATESNEFERSDVAWICFECAAIAAPSSAAPPSPGRSAPAPSTRPGGPGGPPPANASGMPGVPDDPPPSPRMPPRPSGPATVLLNEVLFLPAAGAPQFVELRNTTAAKVRLEGYLLVNQKEKTKALPPTTTIEPGAVALVPLDGFLESSGWVALRKQAAELDRVAWGRGQPGGVRLTRGGMVGDLDPGSTIGRLPRATGWGSSEWVVYSPREVTPGAANPHPGVSVLLPPDGSTVAPSKVTLHWYPVPGAARYRVQVGSDVNFLAPLFDRTVERPPLEVALSAGTYFWRVQAIDSRGEEAPASPAARLVVSDRARPERLAAAARGFAFASASARDGERVPMLLDVPLIKQRKDTGMLQIEDARDSGAHSWRGDHGDLDAGDPADNMNCALAAIAMINAFHGGRLSQDRIGFEVHQGVVAGPAWDINWGEGLSYEEAAKALGWALGTGAYFDRPHADRVDAWTHLVRRIEYRDPVFAVIAGPHAIVITGILHDTGEVVINDPWTGRYLAPFDEVHGARAWYLLETYDELGNPLVEPRSDEPEIAMDSDGDGLVDFDEHPRRFATHPGLADSDQDGLDDLVDVRASVMDANHGYAFGGPGRDFDGDGKAMELDSDSDDGGCFDGLEDRNKNGQHDGGGEQYNFEKRDDACWAGTFELVLEDKEIYEDGDVIHQRHRTYGQGGVTRGTAGRLEGEAWITAALWGVAQNPDCPGDYRYDFAWSVELEGEIHPMGDRGQRFGAKATPDRGPDYDFTWNTACPGEPSRFDGTPWPGWAATLPPDQSEVEERLDIPMATDPSIVEFYTRYTLRRVGNP